MTTESAAAASPDPWAALDAWALAQEATFTAEAAVAACPQAGTGAEVAQHLSAHPSVSRVGDRFWTPRIIAKRASFTLRLLRIERNSSYLIPGHRFLPFHPLSVAADRLTLVMPDGVRVQSKPCVVPREHAESCYSLVGSRFPSPASARSDNNAVAPVFFLYGKTIINRWFSGEVLLRCLDFDKGDYSIAPRPEQNLRMWPEITRRFNAPLFEILRTPPPGPIFAARQALHVVARLLSEGYEQPIGPIGPLLTQPSEVCVALVNGRLALASVQGATGGPLDPPANEGDIAAALARYEADMSRESEVKMNARVQIAGVAWRTEDSTVTATVTITGEVAKQVALRLDEYRTKLHAACPCVRRKLYRSCSHALVLLRDVIARMKVEGDPVAEAIRGNLLAPPWRKELERIQALAEGTVRPQEDGPRRRVLWKVSTPEDVLRVEQLFQTELKSGDWRDAKTVSIDRIARGDDWWITPQDMEAARGGRWGRWWDDGAAVWRLGQLDALLHLAGHPCTFLAGDPPRWMKVDRAEPRLRLTRLQHGGLRLVPTAGGLAMEGGVKVWVYDKGMVFLDSATPRLVVAPATSQAIEVVRAVNALREAFPAAAETELLARLSKLEKALPIDLPQDFAGEEVEADKGLVLQLTPDREAGLVATMRVRPLVGGNELTPGEGTDRVGGTREGKRVFARRTFADETARAREAAQALGLSSFPEAPAWEWRIVKDDDALDLVCRLESACPAGLVVEWPVDGRKMAMTREATPKDLRVEVREAQDWFGIEGEIEVDGVKVALVDLLEAIRAGRRYVPVTKGTWMRISKIFRDRLQGAADLLQKEQKGLVVGLAAAPFLREVVEEAGTLRACQAWTELGRRFQEAMRLSPEPPANFTAFLRPYQLEGYRWLRRLAAWGVGGCLADDMGLGKTIQALAVLVDRAAEGPALVVSPTSVGRNWIEEAQRFAPSLRPVLYRESDRAAETNDIRAGDLVVISYALALRDVERLAKVRWATLVLDEAQFVKNSQSKTAGAIRKIEAGWRIALTGTPIENHLGDLWSLFRAVSPGLFGSWDRFRDRFALPIERDKDVERRKALSRVVQPFILRRTKEEVLSELPERTEILLEAELTPAERELYDRARLSALSKLTKAEPVEDARFQVLAALTRLRQLACHPRLVYPEAVVDSSKVNLLLETVQELREAGHRALVFSQFTSLLALVREALDARGISYRYLDGETHVTKRDEEVKAFQGGQGDLFVISLKAGGTGLNLTGADYVIHLDPWWNPAVEDQATNRAHRIGQTRAVTVYRIVAAGTIEQKILALHAAKRDLVEGVLDGTDRAGKLSVDELIALIRDDRSSS